MKNYQFINYSTWDFSGKGKNIIPYLNFSERELWNLALPFQDSRPDETGHGEYVTYSALNLNRLLGGNRNIIIGGAITHDIGWSKLHSVERQLFSTPKIWERYEPILRLRHQEEGEKFAEEILKKIPSYSIYVDSICEIVSKHDNGKKFLSLEDGIIRSADALWRFSVRGIQLAIEQRNWSEKELRDKWEEWKDKLLYNDIIREIAEKEAENSLNFVKKLTQVK